MNHLYYKKYIKRRLGQNFLNDEIIIKKIISFINPSLKDVLIEIGPGRGALTFPIMKYINKLYAIELDKNLFNYLNQKNNIKKK